MNGTQSAVGDDVPSTPRQPIEVAVPNAPKLGSKPSGALSLEQAPSAALQVGCLLPCHCAVRQSCIALLQLTSM